ncbi:transcriptional regulator, partial [Streptomyces sp. NPDC052015]
HKAADVQKYSVMYEHLRAQALNVEQSRQFIADIAKEYAR